MSPLAGCGGRSVRGGQGKTHQLADPFAIFAKSRCGAGGNRSDGTDAGLRGLRGRSPRQLCGAGARGRALRCRLRHNSDRESSAVWLGRAQPHEMPGLPWERHHLLGGNPPLEPSDADLCRATTRGDDVRMYFRCGAANQASNRFLILRGVWCVPRFVSCAVAVCIGRQRWGRM